MHRSFRFFKSTIHSKRTMSLSRAHKTPHVHQRRLACEALEDRCLLSISAGDLMMSADQNVHSYVSYADISYYALNAVGMTVTGESNGVAGITVAPTSGLITTEAGGSATFAVKLNTQPTANVTIALSSGDTTEGTVSPASITFTDANWDTLQTITVNGVDDHNVDGDVSYTITTAAAVSADASYSGVNATDVTVTNTDNDVARITIAPTSGLVTTEAGGSAAFTVKLDTQPATYVTIPLSSSDTTEGTVSPSSVTFTSDNWNTPQTVTVTGVADQAIDGNVSYTIVTEAAVSTDVHYRGLSASDVAVTNHEVAGIAVTPTNGLVTTEAGGTSTFTVRLNTQPKADVTIDLSSSDTDEGTVSPASLTFTSANWNTPQVVTATGVDDSTVEGNGSYQIVTAAAVSTDASYNGLNAPNVSVINADDDAPGITIAPTSDLATTEAGGAATFSVRLNTQPAGNVTIALSSSDSTEGTVSPASLTFTSVNWNTPQTVTATGVDDKTVDGNVPYAVVTAAAVSTDANYNGLDPSNAAVVNNDNDVAGVTVTPNSGLATTEAGGMATFTVKLNSRPTANVTIALSSSDATEGTVSPTSVTFTSENWNTPQVVTATGVNDGIVDGDAPYTIITAPAVSIDANYDGMDASDVSITNNDDVAGITVTPSSGLVTTETGGTATFSVKLNTQPTADVTFALSSSDATEGTVSPASLTFTSKNWNTPQAIAVTGVNDNVVDGNVSYTIVTAPAMSMDANYDGINAWDVSITNGDNDTAGVTVAPTLGLVTTEAGGAAAFTVKLNSQPTADVTFSLSSSDTSEGTVSPASVTFTSANWNTPQTLTVTGANDDVDDGDVLFTVVSAPAVSMDSNYSNLVVSAVSVTNSDNDAAGIKVTPTSGLVTTEAGEAATFTLKLNAQPTADVTIALSSSDTTEGTVSPASVTFTSTNWNIPQVVTVTGVDDHAVDGNVSYTIVTAPAASTDANYDGMDASNVSVTNTDCVAGITVTPTSGLVTAEAGGAATFTVKLNSRPTADVTIALSSSDTTEGTVSPASLTFTSENWKSTQTVTVTGVDDHGIDGSVSYTIVTAAAVSIDSDYSGLNASDVSVTNNDNDTAGITVTPTSGLVTTEAGGTAAFSVKLSSQPTANVTIALSSSDTSEGTASPASVTFTIDNWNSQQTVTVTGVDDYIADGSVSYTVITAAAVSTDAKYNGMDASDVSVTNSDNDTAGFVVASTSDLATTEAGGTAAFTVALNSQPTADVTIALSSSDTGEGTVSPASLTFTKANWNAPQTVTVTGVDDEITDGNASYSIDTAAAVSTDAHYKGLNAMNVWLTNNDNDVAGITVDRTSGLVTTETGRTAAFTVKLNSRPTADVTIGLSTSDTTEGTVAPANLTFTSANWNTPQTVTITGVDDEIADGSVLYTIITAPAVSADANYNGVNALNVSVANSDDDTAGITVTPTSSLATTEAGGTATFAVQLNSQPMANVTIVLSSSDTTEGMVASGRVTFTAADWNTSQTVTVTGVDDMTEDGDISYTIVTAAVSTDATYNGMGVSDVSVMNEDDDTQALVVSSTVVAVREGSTSQFTVCLNAEPTANVTVTIARQNGGDSDLAADPASLKFTSSNWNKPQTVTLSAAKDTDAANGTARFLVSSEDIASLTITAHEQDCDVASTDAIGLFAPTSSEFYLRNTNDSGYADLAFRYGSANAKLKSLAGDWDHDGIDTVGLYDPATSAFLLRNTNNSGRADTHFAYGVANAGWMSIAGDWNGDGTDSVGLYDPKTSTFFLRNTNDSGYADVVFNYGPGNAGMLPIVGDWDQNGTDTVGLYDPATSVFLIRNANDSGYADACFGFGAANAGWKPVVGDWNADGTDSIGLYNPTNSTFFLRNTNDTGYADTAFGYGVANAGWQPVVGDWNGPSGSPLRTVAASAVAPENTTLLTDSALQPAVTAAIARWAAAGLSASAIATLNSASVHIGDLPGSYLGLAEGHTITIDRDAAGYGWFIDPTPSDDAEFTSIDGSSSLTAMEGTAAANRVDLLTTVMHEMGHLLGYGDTVSDDLMDGTLSPSIRRADAVDELFATLN